MYIPKYSRVDNNSVAFDFITKYNFGVLISKDLQVTHLPFILNNDIIETHMAKANPHWKSIDNNIVKIVFQGPHGLISPRVYEKNSVPTWNYTTVHITGVAKIDKNKSRDILARLLHIHNEDIDEKEINRLISGIIPITIEIKEIETKFKLSQNKSIKERKNIIKYLDKERNYELAEFMRKNS